MSYSKRARFLRHSGEKKREKKKREKKKKKTFLKTEERCKV